MQPDEFAEFQSRYNVPYFLDLKGKNQNDNMKLLCHINSGKCRYLAQSKKNENFFVVTQKQNFLKKSCTFT